MKIRKNISQRTKIVGGKAVDNPDITIYRVGNSNVVVPITPRSIRRFMLMQDDYVQLEFSLLTPVYFGIGDYIQDTIFGKFVITTEQMPRKNPQTGGYDYSLRFDADYMVWRNWLHCLAIGSKRAETRWNLTDRLDAHVQQIADNVNIIINPNVIEQYNPNTGTYSYSSDGYGIEVTATNAAEIKHLAFEGVNIIEAMQMIAEAWSCEWWVTNDSVTNGDTTYAHTIHFGKCEETSNNTYGLTLDTNVESMDIARDQQEYCNRLYAYGGKQNIPEDYDRHLEFTATTRPTQSYFSDTNKPLTIDMIDADADTPVVNMVFGQPSQEGTTASRTYTVATSAVQLSGKQTFTIDLSVMIGITDEYFLMASLPEVSLTARLHYGSSSKLIRVRNFRRDEILDGIGWFADLYHNEEINLGTTEVSVYVEYVWSLTFPDNTHTGDDVNHSRTGRAIAEASAANKTVQVVFNGTTTECTFEGATGRISPKPSGLVQGSKYTISNLIMPKVPQSWLTVDYDAGTLATVGEKRIHLPLLTYPNRYMETDTRSANQIVERAVVFEDIYPKLTLRIKAGTLQGETKQQRVEHSDGSVSYEDWTQWSFEVEMLKENDTWGEFPFRDYYILDGNKLQAVFLAPTTANATGHLLAGMTFDAGFSGTRYTIIRNDDYGVLLPNERLVPTEGDTLILTGWNPRYINDLDMVSVAENELATKASEYLQAIQDGQFTITAKMMSDRMVRYPFCDSPGVDANGRRLYGLLEIGCKVRVNHAALPGGFKVSRVLGFEYKLDIPYDTPTYIVGETEAYSRLRQLEKQITKL